MNVSSKLKLSPSEWEILKWISPFMWFTYSCLYIIHYLGSWNLQFQSMFCVFLCYSSCLTGRRSNVPVVDVPPPIEGGSGSGLAAREQLTTELTFPPTEAAGQLYAYRLNDSAAVLRTREWQPFGSSPIAAIPPTTTTHLTTYCSVATYSSTSSLEQLVQLLLNPITRVFGRSLPRPESWTKQSQVVSFMWCVLNSLLV